MPSTPALSPDVPVADWVDPAALVIDPYPTYARLRREAPVAWVPALHRFLATTYEDCVAIERDQETFSSYEDESRSTMIRTMGRPMIRKDGEEHRDERTALVSAIRPITIRRVWRAEAERLAGEHLDRFRALGSGADLFHEFAAPFAADMLTAVLGLRGIPAKTMQDWSHTLVRGIGNVTGDAAVWAETERVSAEIDAAIDEVSGILRDTPDASIVSAMLHAHNMDDDAFRANVKLAISGGMNEPSHVIASAVFLLDEHPEQREALVAGEAPWSAAFEETARFQSPLGMYPRRATRDTEVGGVSIPEGSTVSVVIAAANRDERRFDEPDVFDVRRDRPANVAFGSGPHVCAGNSLARDYVGGVALPLLYRELPGLRVVDRDAVEFRGWVFRGATSLPVRW